MENNTKNASQAISLPKGGGAIKGIGETFQPDLFTGTGNFTIPIAASPGRGGFGPQLSLQYSTGNGNGPFGLGWNLSIPRVTRKTEKGLPSYNDEDVFVLSGAEDLVLSDNQLPAIQPTGYSVKRYRPRTEGLFARIEKWNQTRTDGTETGDVHWRITTKDNTTNIYGKSKTARITDPDHADRVYEWLIEETFDNKGNHLLYEYIQENPALQINEIYEQNKTYTQTYIRRILYGNTTYTLDGNTPHDTLNPSEQVGQRRVGTHHLIPTDTLERHYLFELLFDYGGDYGDTPGEPGIPYVRPLSEDATIPENWPKREDPFSTFRPGFEVRTLRWCRRVLMLHHFVELSGAPLVRSTDFEYDINPDTKLSHLTEAKVTGYKAEGNSYRSSTMPPVSFTYSTFEPQKQRYQSVAAEGNDLPPKSLNDPEFSLVDLFGDALPDVVQSTNAGYYFWQNLGNAKIDRRHPQHNPVPSVSAVQPNVAFGDMGGDGLVDLVVEAPPMSGFFESTPDGRWKPFKKFKTFPSVSLSDPNVRMVDLTGDGLSDILMTRDYHFLWFKCLGEEGYDEPKHISRVRNLNEFPDIYFNDPSGRVRLADMTGDGLNDIVLVHSGRIDYWPNLGRGHFGKRVTMAHSPRMTYNYDPKRLFLADLDSSGCADLVYVDFDSVHFWFNQSGNGWSGEKTIQGTPYVTDLSSIQFSDFFGTGTTSLIWSYDYQRQSGGNYKVLDFCGGKKPYLVVGMTNNMGATTQVQYASSTKFYLEDKKAFKPWATNLPFPVQVVEKNEIIDHISKTKLVTTYKYHHGYYDGREREFRGFGRVDQYDTEEFDHFSGSSLHGEEAEFVNNDNAYHVPPVLTRTWFHTGVYFDEDNVSPSGEFYDHQDLMDAYKQEFYQGDADAFVLNGHKVEETETPHEAYRALRGSAIRTETFALDGTGKAYHPYAVAETRYQVQELQSRDTNNHAVYLTNQIESVSYHYERNPNDPRIAQELVLAVDEYGQVTDSISIAYPRRQVPQDLPEQADLKMIYTKADYINKDNETEYYYLGIPCQTRTYEVTGVAWSSGQAILTADLFGGILDPAFIPGSFHPYEWQRPDGHVGLGKRIIEWSRSYFRTDESAEVLDINLNAQNHPTRTLSNRLPLGEITRLALPYEAFTASCTDDILADNYINTTGVTPEMMLEGAYHQEPDITDYWWVPGGQQLFNQGLFYLSDVARDPFAVDSHITYDKYALAVIGTRDVLENITRAQIDYRVLQPGQVTDPNGNHAFAAFDTLGLVVGTAVQSKTGEGDTLEGFVADLTESQILDYVENPLENGTTLLARATTRKIYDLFAYIRGEAQSPGSHNPPVVATLSREIHDSELGSGEVSPVQQGFLYSDGFGREVQSKVQAEPDNATPNTPRWVGTGTTIYNNKGKPVKQYEPFFSDTHAYGIKRHGVSPTLFYDPLERVFCTLRPNHTYEKVVFDPWRQESWDVNDTVLEADPKNDSDVGTYFHLIPEDDYLPTWYEGRRNGQLGPYEESAATKAADHANTPAIAHLDTLGRTFLTIADNGTQGQYRTHIEFDIEGNQLAVTDAKGRIVMQYSYDIASNVHRQVSMEAGSRWMLNDVAGKAIYGWDSRGHRLMTTYDQLQRPTELYVSTDGAPEVLAERIVYGETQPNPEQLNLRGQVYRVYDGAGVVTSLEFDFKGNLLSGQRELLRDYDVQVDWSQSPPREQELFTGRTRFDALNRVVQSITPHSDQGNNNINVIQPVYNEANLLERVNVWLEESAEPQEILDPATANMHAVRNIEYDAKGQRTRIEYGNSTFTAYMYDDETYRLIRLETIRSGLSVNEQQRIVQDLSYTYDPVGNITHIQDDADIHNVIFFKNQRVEPSNDYVYDAVYRLIRANGREHVGQASRPWTSYNDAGRVSLEHPHNGRAMRNYTEYYEYDAVGNFEKLIHQAFNGNWTRDYTYSEPSQIEPATHMSNRLTRTTVGAIQEAEVYSVNGDGYDSHGNILKMPQLHIMEWDFKDQLFMSQRQVVNGEDEEGRPRDGERTYYVYDAAGERARKVTNRQNGTRKEERIYLGGFEIYREYDSNGSTPKLERETLHVMDDKQRIVMVETKTIGNVNDTSPRQLFRYQFGNHLGSASLELDNDANPISYEEYHPYGTTSYQAVDKTIKAAAKRYRYTGMERDEESGLNYHGARYYASWLGRWTSTDPAGYVDGLNLYRYSRNNPVIYNDPSGKQSVWEQEGDFPDRIQTKSPSKAGKRDELLKYSKHDNLPLKFWGQDIEDTESFTDNSNFSHKSPYGEPKEINILSGVSPSGRTYHKWLQLNKKMGACYGCHVTHWINGIPFDDEIPSVIDLQMKWSALSVAGTRTLIASTGIGAVVDLGIGKIIFDEPWSGWDALNIIPFVPKGVKGVTRGGGGLRKAGDVLTKSQNKGFFSFWDDIGGRTTQVSSGAPYTGKLSWLNRLGLRQGISTKITNLDKAGSWFARTDTAFHEGFHALVGKHLPSVWRLGNLRLGRIPIGAPVKYLHEVGAYAIGHAGALRIHGVPFAPLEAFQSLTFAESAFTVGVGLSAFGIYELTLD